MKDKAIEYKGGKCEKCSYSSCKGAMDFHHPDPNGKDFAISNGSYGWEKIRREIDKCILLCCRCHREIHHEWYLIATKERELKEEARTNERKNEIERKYSSVDENKLRILINSYSVREVANSFNTTERIIKRLCEKFRISTSQWRFQKPKNSSEPHKKPVDRKYKTSWPSDSKLAKMVWTEPVTTIAKRLGISDKAVKKRCVKLGIQTPGPGYWTKLASG